MAGRRPMPSWRKRLSGMRRSRINRREPEPVAQRPMRPRHLMGHARSEWDRLATLTDSMQVLTLPDGPLLEATCSAYAEYRRALAVVETTGAYYEARTAAGAVMLRAHPAVAAAADAWRRYVTGLGHFGLSPSTRAKVARAQVQREDKLSQFLDQSERAATRDPLKFMRSQR